MKRVLALLGLAAALLLSACTGSDAVDQSGLGTFKYEGGTKLGTLYPQADRKPAGNFTAPLLDGGKVSLSASRGKIVVLNFWASWCGPCKTETPQFDLVYRSLKNEGVDFFGINTKDDRDSAKSFVRLNDITFPMIYDEQGETAIRLGHIPDVALPFTVLIDAKGKVAAVYQIALSAKDLRTAIDALQAER